ncbi:MAG: hypothetical protein A3G87_05735 [Omnitrophica bacterium RIFCSPLOWO2_12_FULL_50_11]|nr:MAG: hypothetical protein A3G87_05735 [Omnitrophica bacterium RIFCSPLOWO2_12_FULL_50_11]
MQPIARGILKSEIQVLFNLWIDCIALRFSLRGYPRPRRFVIRFKDARARMGERNLMESKSIGANLEGVGSGLVRASRIC